MIGKNKGNEIGKILKHFENKKIEKFMQWVQFLVWSGFVEILIRSIIFFFFFFRIIRRLSN